MTAYELAQAWQAWLEHWHERSEEEEFTPACVPGDCLELTRAIAANAAVIDDQKAYTDEALRQQGQWSGGKRDA